ncbi:MAG: hypothetical protein WKI04_10860 [Ferruginibacter sp.]
MSSTVVYIIAGYLILLVVAYLVQELFIFKPEKLKQNFQYKYNAPFRELFFDVEPGVRINGLHFHVDKPHGWYYISTEIAVASKAGRNMLQIFFGIIMMWYWLITGDLGRAPVSEMKKIC